MTTNLDILAGTPRSAAVAKALAQRNPGWSWTHCVEDARAVLLALDEHDASNHARNLPEEPAEGSVVVVCTPKTIPLAYLRSVVDDRDAWRQGGARGFGYTWVNLHASLPPDATVTVLVPNPLATSVTLPFTAFNDETSAAVEIRVGVEEDGTRLVVVAIDNPIDLKPEEARLVGRVLFAAADQAERAP